MSIDFSCPNSQPTPTIILGEDQNLDVKLTDSSTGDPFDLSSASEIVAKLLNADNTALSLTKTANQITLVSAIGGHMKIIISAAQSALLAVSPTGGLSNIELYITIGGKVTIVQLVGVVSVISRIFN